MWQKCFKHKKIELQNLEKSVKFFFPLLLVGSLGFADPKAFTGEESARTISDNFEALPKCQRSLKQNQRVNPASMTSINVLVHKTGHE